VDRISALLERSAPFGRLDEDERRRLLGSVVVEYFGPDEVILEQGRTEHRHLYVVESGFVRLLDGETQRLVGEFGEGGVFGSHGLIRHGPLPYEARAVEPTVCVLVPAEEFGRLYAEHSDFAAFFESDLSRYSRVHRASLDAASARLLFGTRLGELVRREPLVCGLNATAREVARLMREAREDSAVVMGNGEVLGILSDADLRDKLVAEGAPAETPVERLMSPQVILLPAAAPVFEALMQMMGQRAGHVVVTAGREGRPLGVVTDGDISRAQGSSPLFVIERAEGAGSVGELARVRADAMGTLVDLARQGVSAEDLITINTEVNDRLMRRALMLVEAELREEPPVPPCGLPWAWMSLGSEGRGEMSVFTDQDNALVYADPENPEEAARAEAWFGALAGRANAALAEVGFALCKGDVMARNPAWRHPLGGWKEVFGRWVLDPDSQTLLEAAIFFDLRPLHGEAALVEEIKDSILGDLARSRRFLPMLVSNALSSRPPGSSPLGRFIAGLARRDGGMLDLKRQGLRPLVDAARVFAMQTGYLDSPNTADRYEHAARVLPDMARTAESALEAHRYLSELRFRLHLRALERGEAPTNRVSPSALNETQRNMLEAVFSTVVEVQATVAHRFGVGPRL